MSDWPYPFWIAHRGAGTSAPENTISAFIKGYQSGFHMFECDAQVSSDDVVLLMHDETLDRTTNGSGLAVNMPWSALKNLDAGSWFSTEFKNEPLATLEDAFRFCQHNNCFLNIEIKPCRGHESRTGEIVARKALELWQTSARKPLLTSFSETSLTAAAKTAPELPLGLLMESHQTSWMHLVEIGICRAIVCHFEIIDKQLINQARSAGVRILGYTINDDAMARWLIDLGIDGIITDRLDLPRTLGIL